MQDPRTSRLRSKSNVNLIRINRFDTSDLDLGCQVKDTSKRRQTFSKFRKDFFHPRFVGHICGDDDNLRPHSSHGIDLLPGSSDRRFRPRRQHKSPRTLRRKPASEVQSETSRSARDEIGSIVLKQLR
jgi:hypothetical protein